MKNIQDVIDTILAVLVPEKKKHHIEVAKLDQLYREIDGERIPWKDLGFPSLVGFLETIKGLDIYRENGSHYLDFHGTDKTAHLSELVAHQRTNKNKKMPLKRKQIPSHYFSNRPYAKLEDDRQSNVETHKVATFFDDESDPEYDDVYEESNSINLNQSTTSDRLKIQNIIQTSMNIQNSKNIYSSRHGTGKQADKNYIDQWNDNSAKDVNDADDNEEGDKYFFDICTKTREKLVKLIKKRPEGIKCAKLPDIYYQEYHEVLDWEDYSCDSLTQFACNLPEIFHLVKPNSHCDFILYDVTKPRPDYIPDEPQEESLSPLRRNNVVPLSLLPVPNHIKNSCLASDVVKLGEYVKPFNTSDPQYQRLIKRDWELIDVVDVFSPSFFWIHLHKLAPSAFEDMMNELHYFYEEKKTEYTIHIEYAVGLNVACKFDQSWHRGIIKEIITGPEKKAKVFFYDYGTMSEYPFSELYLLKRAFAQLPVQAIPCGLYGVRPIGDDWKPDDRRYFVQKVYGKTLYAMAYNVNPENNFLLLHLTDTSGDEDIHFNDELVNKDIAKSDSVCIRPEIFQMPRAIKKVDKTLNLSTNNDNNNNDNNSCLVPKINSSNIIKKNDDNITNIVDKIHDKVFDKFLLVPQMCGKDRKALIVKEILREVTQHVLDECKNDIVDDDVKSVDKNIIDISSLRYDNDHKNNDDDDDDEKLSSIKDSIKSIIEESNTLLSLDSKGNEVEAEEKNSGISLPVVSELKKISLDSGGDDDDENKDDKEQVILENLTDKKTEQLSSVEQDKVNNQTVNSTEVSDESNISKANDEKCLNNFASSSTVDNAFKQKEKTPELIQNNVNDDQDHSSIGPTGISDLIMSFGNNDDDYPQDYSSVSGVPSSQSKTYSLKDYFSGNVSSTSLLRGSSSSVDKNTSSSHPEELLSTAALASDLIDWKFFGVAPNFKRHMPNPVNPFLRNQFPNHQRGFVKHDHRNYQKSNDNYQRYQKNYPNNYQRDNYYSNNKQRDNYSNNNQKDNYYSTNFRYNKTKNFEKRNYQQNYVKNDSYPKIVPKDLRNNQVENTQNVQQVIHKQEKFYTLFINNQDDKIDNYKCLLVENDDTYKINLKNKLNEILGNSLKYKTIIADIFDDTLSKINDKKEIVKAVDHPVVTNVSILSSLKKMLAVSLARKREISDGKIIVKQNVCQKNESIDMNDINSDDLTSENELRVCNSSSKITEASVDGIPHDKIVGKQDIYQKNKSIDMGDVDSDDLTSENKSQILNSLSEDTEASAANDTLDSLADITADVKESLDGYDDLVEDSMNEIQTDKLITTVDKTKVELLDDNESSEDVSPNSSKSDASSSSSLDTNLLSDCVNDDHLNTTRFDNQNNLEISLPNNSIPIFNDLDIPSDESDWEVNFTPRQVNYDNLNEENSQVQLPQIEQNNNDVNEGKNIVSISEDIKSISTDEKILIDQSKDQQVEETIHQNEDNMSIDNNEIIVNSNGIKQVTEQHVEDENIKKVIFPSKLSILTAVKNLGLHENCNLSSSLNINSIDYRKKND